MWLAEGNVGICSQIVYRTLQLQGQIILSYEGYATRGQHYSHPWLHTVLLCCLQTLLNSSTGLRALFAFAACVAPGAVLPQAFVAVICSSTYLECSTAQPIIFHMHTLNRKPFYTLLCDALHSHSHIAEGPCTSVSQPAVKPDSTTPPYKLQCSGAVFIHTGRKQPVRKQTERCACKSYPA